ncbi:recombination protein RecT [Dysgonomonas sp. PFB1-18]|uniref:recombinase RecT n=1 Tax=unclassified Dysgonomonas TaxID=2630389 RepID=UPI002473F723|nr:MULTISPECIES: recombinase RecT [unclassified Dysgonomonas]MDH6307988.1 recombination protein RecT [Dysgonomonas sp. PF1-14]MDH6339527.1 recombination protein RecT [Dysgonomonas sp. PF1-16]MDH6381178.1 recombination protein RecT [Dysgonomonas sp. PFB1-18]MDH6398390.1 recombination protein RecT [Dysgonomonas sp. PF1-23]
MTQQAVKGTGSNVPAQTKKIDVLKNMLNAPSVMEQFQNALSKSAPTFVASVIDLYNGDSNLQMCEPKAVVMEALKAAVLKLPINKALGYAFIIPFNNSVKDEKGNWTKKMMPTFQMGYKGYIQLAMRTGQYKTINADVVYEGELRKVNKLTGEIAFDGEKTSDKVVGYFCYFELMNGFSKTLYMTVEQMADHAKRYSKGLKKETTVESLMNLANLPVATDSKTVGWMGNFHGMAVKTVIRNLLSKYGYLSVEMQEAIQNDTEGDTDVRDSLVEKNGNIQTFEISDTHYEDVTEAENQPKSPEEVDPGY